MYIGDTTNSTAGYPCHSGLRAVNNPKLLASNFNPIPERLEAANHFWDWISDPKRSPWRKLFSDGIELIRDPEGIPKGWIIEGDILKKTPFNFQKNFCIATRVFCEKPKNFDFWWMLVQKGVDELDALYLCSSCQGTKDKVSISSYGNLSGGHWPLTEQSNYGAFLDWNALRKGEPNFDSTVGGTINNIWCKTKGNPFLLKNVKTTANQGAFSTSVLYNLEDILQEFHKWQDKEGLLK